MHQHQQLVQEAESTLAVSRKGIDKILVSCLKPFEMAMLMLQKAFNPALDTLVDVVSRKFASAFEREGTASPRAGVANALGVGCSGEVQVDRADRNFANWGIKIMVSYRDTEQLAQLTASRQSGGVRFGDVH